MASSERVGILVDIGVKGRDQLKGATQDLNQLGNAGGALSKATSGFQGMAVAAAGVGVALGAAALAAKKAWSIMSEGAELQRTAARFDKLSASIGTTADVLTARLRAATHGTISDMQLMASASQLISLRLADNADQVVRLGAVAGTLNWDMQQVILTMANMSTMRLDALGLSVSDVTEKARELELQGLSSSEAFKEAVIQAGEAQKALLDTGDDALRSAQQAEAAWTNAFDSMKMAAASFAQQTGLTWAVKDISEGVAERALSDAELTMKRAAELVAAAESLSAGQGFAIGDGRTAQMLTLATVLDEKLRNQVSTINKSHISDTEKAISLLTAYRPLIEGDAAAVQLLDQAIADLNGQLEEQARQAALAAAGGRDLADVYTEWITNSEALTGDAAANFLKSFNDAIGATTSANIDMGPLIDMTTQFEDGSSAAGEMEASVMSANAALYAAAEAAGANASQLAILGVATGQFTEAEADAALKSAILQGAIERLATQYLNNEISIYAVNDALREQINLVMSLPSMFDAAMGSARSFDLMTGGGGGQRPWYEAGPMAFRETEETAIKATRAAGGYVKEIEKIPEIYGRMASAFSAEVFYKAPVDDPATKRDEGGVDTSFILENGLVNIEAANKALFKQAEIAGATAGELAILGVATGQFTAEQAQAALKASILTEKIHMLGAAVASGQLTPGDAAAGLETFRQQLDSGEITAAAEGVSAIAAAADEIAAGTYEAEITVEDKAAWVAINEVVSALETLSGTYYVNIVTTQSTAGGGGAAPELQVNNSPSPAVVNGRSGGSTYDVKITNYIEGQSVPRSTLDDITEDKMKNALQRLGIR